jgi:beta-lactamase superfamily II metal-dependent hydrolase
MILEDSEWPTLLAKTTFLKVGHHGSHNATPKQFVEDILPKPPTDFWAMVSTIKRGSWPIPKKELMAALGKRTKKLVRSDQIPQAQQGVFASKASLYVETEIPI